MANTRARTASAVTRAKKKRKVKHRARRCDWDALELESERASPAYAYILENDRHQVFTGSAHNPSARLRHHNNGYTPSTRSRRPWRLAVTVGPFRTSTAARRFFVERGGGGVEPKIIVADRALKQALGPRTSTFRGASSRR